MRILIIAGPNGAGKTTFAEEFLPREANCPVFLNADQIAAAMRPADPGQAAVPAGRAMIRAIAERVGRGEDFAIETTLAGRRYARLIPEWQRLGYRVQLVFLGLANPEQALARVAQRVLEGGHFIPEATVRRRFDAGRRNFEDVFRDLVDDWAEYDAAQAPAARMGASSVTAQETPPPRERRSSGMDLRGAEAAMKRAAVVARRRAAMTTGELILWRDGKLVREKVSRDEFPELADESESVPEPG